MWARTSRGEFGHRALQRAGRIAFARPQVVDPGDLERDAARFDDLGLVAQDANPAGGQRVGDGLVQAAVPPPAQGVPDREIVVPEHRVDAERGPQPAQRACHVVDVPIALVDEVAGQGDQVRLVRQCPLDHFGQVVRRQVFAAVEVGQVGDPRSRPGPAAGR